MNTVQEKLLIFSSSFLKLTSISIIFFSISFYMSSKASFEYFYSPEEKVTFIGAKNLLNDKSREDATTYIILSDEIEIASIRGLSNAISYVKTNLKGHIIIKNLNSKIVWEDTLN